MVRIQSEPTSSPWSNRVIADARQLPLVKNSVDLCLTSPPYWRKRKYGHAKEIGQEKTAVDHAESIREVLWELRRVLKPTGSVFLNLGDSYHRRSLAGVPNLVEEIARTEGWRIRNRIIWAKPNGVPSPHQDRLANRHEVVLHLTGSGPYFYDLNALSEFQKTRFPGGDFWEIAPERNHGAHPAAFPSELAGRVIALACPPSVCRRCGRPRMPIVGRTMELDPSRPQAQRALDLFRSFGLRKKHLAAIRATGISDAGKAKRIQSGTNSKETILLARHAKRILGGYFREFTFGRRVTIGFNGCRCAKGFHPGLVIDVFAGTGTTVQTALAMKRRALGLDLLPWAARLKVSGKKHKRRPSKPAKKKGTKENQARNSRRRRITPKDSLRRKRKPK